MDDFQFTFTSIYVVMAFLAVLFSIESTIKGFFLEKQQRFCIILFSICYVLFFGSRGEEIGSDTSAYLTTFSEIGNSLTINDLKDPGFYLFGLLVKNLYNNDQFFLTCMSAFYLFPISVSILYLPITNKFLLFFVFVSFFFFESLGINVVRQGVSIAFFILAITKEDGNRKRQILILIFSFLFHASIMIAILFYLISKKISDIKIPLFFLIISSLFSFFEFNIYDILGSTPIVGSFIQKRLNSYVNIDQFQRYSTGFRIDFFMFNLLFASIGYYFYNNSFLMNKFPKYKNYFFTYLFLTGYFFLMFGAIYSDRFGVLSWALLPLILMPFLEMSEIIKNGAFKIIGIGISIFIAFNLLLS